MPTPERNAAIRQPHETELLSTDDTRVRLLIDSDDTGGTVSTVEVTLARGADGAAPHFHTRSDELFYVADGELQLLAGEEIVTVGAGGSIVVPRYMTHAFGATPDSGARILIALMPGVQRFDYFRLLDRIAKGEATLADLAATQDEFDNHFVDAPHWWRERTAGRD
ncbi:cupin domain-containing protein [Nocardia cyriacigeorgica]|uniref:cupin domain-containing protein n=1 Tax=Nocardia cyriacigeorgica TaxID=135487 RepID=UPI0018932A21|nr:cupin domain-containing protein [Nocardia cyriacigeorgica]MBF6320094.1 cupin domain-containing protein [Nocardia cyriacigeorgica]MBF6534512.1 cupin domain-containing protein [Nocardia cyriacigeorgica]